MMPFSINSDSSAIARAALWASRSGGKAKGNPAFADSADASSVASAAPSTGVAAAAGNPKIAPAEAYIVHARLGLFGDFLFRTRWLSSQISPPLVYFGNSGGFSR